MSNPLIRIKLIPGRNVFIQKITGLACALLLCTIVLGQTSFRKPLLNNTHILDVNVWGAKEGLPSWLIFSMITDRSGAKWFTSNRGLCRFDGQTFTNYEAKSFGILEFTYLYQEDKSKNLIILGRNSHSEANRLMVFSTTQKKLIPIQDYITSGYDPGIEEHIYKIMEYGTTLYIKSMKGQMWELKDQSLRRLINNTDSVNSEDEVIGPAFDGHFWHIKGDTVFRIQHANKQRILSHIHTGSGTNYYFADQMLNIWGVSFDQKMGMPQYFTINSKGYAKISWADMPRAAELHQLSWYREQYIPANQQGYSFLLSGKGFHVYYRGKLLAANLDEILTEHKLNLARDYFIDPTDPEAVWVVTQKGLARISIKKNEFRTYQSTQNLSIRGIYSEKNQIYFNSYKGSFKMNDQSDAVLTPLLPTAITSRNYPLGMLGEADSLWIGMGGDYALTYQTRTGVLKKYFLANTLSGYYSGYVFQRTPDGQLYLGCDLGLLKFDQQQKEFVAAGLENTPINCFRFYNGALWIGTKKGLFKFQDSIISEIGKKTLSDLRISNIYIDPEDNFWLSTDQGLIRWHPDKQIFETYTNHNGVPHLNIHAVYPDQLNNLWGSSDDGLFYFNTQYKTFTTFGEDDGLPNNECNFTAHTKNREGRLFFGTISGIFSFHPDSIRINKIQKINNLSITNITLLGNEDEQSIFTKWQQNQAELVIGAWVNQVNIYLSAPYYGSETVIYQWRIPGVIDVWQNSTSQKISLFKVPQGKQTIEVRASTLSSNPSDVLLIQLYIEPPLTQRWWFIALVLLLTAGLAGIGFRLRLRAIRQQNDLLEAEVINRTKEIKAQHEHILKQEEDLRLLDRAKIRFFENINHELRTPLTIMMGYTRKLLLHNEFVSDDDLRSINLIEQNLRQLQELSEEMLEFARLDAGKIPVIWVSIRWKEYMQHVVNNLTGIAASKKISLELIFDNNTPHELSIPQKKVTRVLNNLIENALKFTPAGGEIVVRSNVTQEYVQIVITDTGIGIPQAELNGIFERFYRSNRTSDRTGYGIGLSLCQEYAVLIGGQIEVQSIEGKGSTFTFTFPRKDGIFSDSDAKTEDLNYAPQMPNTQISVTQHTSQHPPVAHLLIVEDNRDMQAYLWDLLHTNYHISLANNGHEALQILKQAHNIDLVISDVMMPGMDGYEMLSAMRADDKLKLMPTIFLTALSDTENISEGLRLGVNAYLTKPFSEQELAARIQNLLQFKSIRQTTYAESATSLTSDNFSQNSEAVEAVEFRQIEDDLIPAYDEVWIQDLEAIVKKYLDQPGLKIESLANEMYISERTFRNKIKLYTGLSPAEYLMNARLNKALYLLESRRYGTISEVCYAVGLKNPSHFTRAFRQAFGKLPSDYLKK